jgi:phage shock protein PspC (stress-responsive transcriptional regulator)
MSSDPTDPTPPRPGGPDDETRTSPALGGGEGPTGAYGSDETREDGRAAAHASAADETRQYDPDPAATASAPAAAPEERGLSRSATDRVLFGVCGGIAERYGFEPLLVRLGFLLTLFLGGAGVLFYLAAAVLIPNAPTAAGGTPRPGGAVGAANGLLRWTVGLAVAIAVFFALCAVAAVSFGATILLGAWPVAIVLLVICVLLLVSARNRRTAGTLLVLALALAVPATAAVVADVHVDPSAGQRTVRPVSQARAAQGYELGMGRLVVDLRSLELRRGDRVTVPASVDIGTLGVILPRRACVAWTVDSRVRIGGRTDVLGDELIRNDWTTTDGSRRTVEIDPVGGRTRRGASRPRVTLELRTGIGEIVVGHSRREIDGWSPMSRTDVTGGDDLLRTAACRTSRERSAR